MEPKGTSWGCIRGGSGHIYEKASSVRGCLGTEYAHQKSGHSTEPDRDQESFGQSSQTFGLRFR